MPPSENDLHRKTFIPLDTKLNIFEYHLEEYNQTFPHFGSGKCDQVTYIYKPIERELINAFEGLS